MLVTVPLAAPPVVVTASVDVHGVHRSHDEFRLPLLWQLHLYRYVGTFTLGGEPHTIRPGSVSLTPADQVVKFDYLGRSQHLVVHFALPGASGEAASGGSELGTPAAVTGATTVTLPAVSDTGPIRGEIEGRMLAAIAAGPHTAAASAHVWSALWLIAGLTQRTAGGHPVVAAARAELDSRLSEPVSVADLARRLGVSHNHLTRLFHREYGQTIVGYLRAQRMSRAQHLLTSSTLPIASVAAAVGIPDLQAFNKTCRAVLGASPRAVRERGIRPADPIHPGG